MKRLIILGASGSIGQQTLQITNDHPELFEVVGVSVGQNIDFLKKLLVDSRLKYVCVAAVEDYELLKQEYPNIIWYYGDDGLSELANKNDYDLLVNALVGFVGVLPTLRALDNNKDVALANKETLVAAGNIVKSHLAKSSANLIPVDSEHSAIFQCLIGCNNKDIKKLILTASGGSFRDKKRSELASVKVSDALKHPNWTMGAKITIDSATLMNKAFEVIEAYHLFDVAGSDIKVLIHPQSIVHSLVTLNDDSTLAQLGCADMRIPIQFALTYPRHLSISNTKELTLTDLNFKVVDEERFPFIALAYQVIESGDALGCVINAANEVAVSAFLSEKISFLKIEELVFMAIKQFKNYQAVTLKEILELNAKVRSYVKIFTEV
ncbi:MAG: 1-deoxy-D-xylulose-5-phosphate reductoisomerase [Erysipelotrichaceae bacterium]